jgi:hypothetical protein
MQCFRDVINRGAAAGEFLLYHKADPLDEVLVALFLRQLSFKLRSKHAQEFGIACNERAAGSDFGPFVIGSKPRPWRQS